MKWCCGEAMLTSDQRGRDGRKNDAGEEPMLVHQSAALARHNPFGARQQGDAAAASGAERDQMRAESILVRVG
jgi:hypothetical protein